MKIIFYSIVFCVSQIAFSQNGDVNIKTIKTELYKPFNKPYKTIGLTLKVNDLKIDANHLVKIKSITKAITNNGEELEQEAVFMKDDFVNTHNLKIAFKEPLKQTKSIKLIQGTLEYFQVSKKHNSLFTKNDILHKYHINLFKESPLRLKLVLIDETRFFKLRWTKPKAYHKTLQHLKEKEKISDSIDYFFKQLFSEAPLLNKPFENYYKNILVFYIEDSANLFFDIQVFNNLGERIDTGYEITPKNHKLTIHLKKEEKYQSKKLQLKMKIKTPESISNLNFAIADVKLD